LKKPKASIDASMRYRISMALRKEYFMSESRKAVVKRCETATPSLKKDGTSKLRLGKQMYTRRYQCEVCNKEDLTIVRKRVKGTGGKSGKKAKYHPAEFQIDHIDPVSSMPGTRDAPRWWRWDYYFARMFVGKEGLQGICHECHILKTKDDKDDIRSGKFFEDVKHLYIDEDGNEVQ